jgi:hypothetical protein
LIIQQPPVTDNGKIEFFNFLPDCGLGIFGQNSCFPKTESIGWTAASQILSSIDRASLIFAFPALTEVSKKRWKMKNADGLSAICAFLIGGGPSSFGSPIPDIQDVLNSRDITHL